MPRYKCEECGRNDFTSAHGLTQHIDHVHPSRQPDEAKADDRQLTTEKSKSPAKTGSLDAAIEKLLVPEIPEQFNGASQIYWAGFNKGVSYGVDTILAGIRAAQELSALGISQATPIIKMAQEMRQAEGQAAQEIAGQLAQVNMETNQQVLSAINALAASQGKGQPAATNPMMEMMVESMKPQLQQVMSQALSGMFMGTPQPAAGQQQLQPSQQQQQQTEAWQPPNITRRSIDEYEEDDDV